MPSVTSHGISKYYAHASNAFWWIAGEALNFRRGGPHCEKNWPNQFQTKPSKSIIEGLQNTSAPILSYEDQVERLTEAGYALWDVVRECDIRNSDDNSVTNSKPNDIRGFIEKDQPSIRRIVFASGKTSASIFIRLNKKWLMEGNFSLGGGEFTSDVFAKFVNDSQNCQVNPIQLVVPVSVSPAAASVPFKSKKDHWLSCVFNA